MHKYKNKYGRIKELENALDALMSVEVWDWNGNCMHCSQRKHAEDCPYQKAQNVLTEGREHGS